MWSTTILALFCAIATAWSYPVDEPRRVGSFYVLNFEDQQHGSTVSEEIDNYIPNGDYTRKIPFNIVIGVIPTGQENIRGSSGVFATRPENAVQVN